jgi:hypothetical protein
LVAAGQLDASAKLGDDLRLRATGKRPAQRMGACADNPVVSNQKTSQEIRLRLRYG